MKNRSDNIFDTIPTTSTSKTSRLLQHQLTRRCWGSCSYSCPAQGSPPIIFIFVIITIIIIITIVIIIIIIIIILALLKVLLHLQEDPRPQAQVLEEVNRNTWKKDNFWRTPSTFFHLWNLITLDFFQFYFVSSFRLSWRNREGNRRKIEKSKFLVDRYETSVNTFYQIRYCQPLEHCKEQFREEFMCR